MTHCKQLNIVRDHAIATLTLSADLFSVRWSDHDGQDDVVADGDGNCGRVS